MTRAAKHNPAPAYAIAVTGIALFSIMDMLMKGLTLAIGTFATLLWRSLIGIALAAIPFLATRNPWPRGTALRLHLLRGTMMVPMALPPFELLYREHRNEVFGFLVRRVGRERAEDAFQETFLRALRAYGRLEHGEHLRAWVLTIATNTVVDAARRERPTAQLAVEPAGEDERPAVEELAPLTDRLPLKERAAVVLRYGYDLDYDTIGAALGSNEEAARQAASAGVRRLRKEKEQR